MDPESDYIMISFLLDGSHWTGPDGIPTLLVQHLMYTFAALAVAAVIAIPLGLYIGHTGRGSVVVAGLANSLRALPTIGLLILLVLIIAPSFPNKLAYLIPSLIVLVLLAIPPILTNTYAGVRAVDQAAVDAARGMGFRSMRILTEVEIPCAATHVVRHQKCRSSDRLHCDCGRLHFVGRARPVADRRKSSE